MDWERQMDREIERQTERMQHMRMMMTLTSKGRGDLLQAGIVTQKGFKTDDELLNWMLQKNEELIAIPIEVTSLALLIADCYPLIAIP
jgi:hypothetical protein